MFLFAKQEDSFPAGLMIKREKYKSIYFKRKKNKGLKLIQILSNKKEETFPKKFVSASTLKNLDKCCKLLNLNLALISTPTS